MKRKMSCCNICCEPIEISLSCSYCQFEACDLCVAKYILGNMAEPSCMSCRKLWSCEFIMEKFERSWIQKDFMPHMARLMMEKEKMLLPETQHEANLIREIRQISEIVKDLPTNSKIERLYKKDTILLNQKMNDNRKEKQHLYSKMSELKVQTITYSKDEKLFDKIPKHVYIMKCPLENCRGFINDKYDCGTCKSIICDKCHLVKTTDHKCNKDDIKSALLIVNETKPCPKCMTPIFKNGGCNQIFCTQCHAAFDWITGEIEKGAIHNPHFYEWLANQDMQPDNIEEIACGELPNINHIQYSVSKMNNINRNKVYNIYRILIHVRDVEILNFKENKVKNNFDLRVNFLLNEYDEDKWTMKIMNREKKRMKIKACHDILQLLITVFSDFIRQIVYNKMTKIDEIYKQFNQFKTYFDESLDNIIEIHGGTISNSLKFEFI